MSSNCIFIILPFGFSGAPLHYSGLGNKTRYVVAPGATLRKQTRYLNNWSCVMLSMHWLLPGASPVTQWHHVWAAARLCVPSPAPELFHGWLHALRHAWTVTLPSVVNSTSHWRHAWLHAAAGRRLSVVNFASCWHHVWRHAWVALRFDVAS